MSDPISLAKDVQPWRDWFRQRAPVLQATLFSGLAGVLLLCCELIPRSFLEPGSKSFGRANIVGVHRFEIVDQVTDLLWGWPFAALGDHRVDSYDISQQAVIKTKHNFDLAFPAALIDVIAALTVVVATFTFFRRMLRSTFQFHLGTLFVFTAFVAVFLYIFPRETEFYTSLFGKDWHDRAYPTFAMPWCLRWPLWVIIAIGVFEFLSLAAWSFSQLIQRITGRRGSSHESSPSEKEAIEGKRLVDRL